MARVTGTFAGTGRVFTDIATTSGYIRGGKKKSGSLVIDMGAATTVILEASLDEGATWVVDSTYSWTGDTVEYLEFPDDKTIYTLNCTVFGASTPYSMSDSHD